MPIALPGMLKRVVRRAGNNAFMTQCMFRAANERAREDGRTDENDNNTHDVPGADPAPVLQEQLHYFHFSILRGDVQQRATVLEETEEDDEGTTFWMDGGAIE